MELPEHPAEERPCRMRVFGARIGEGGTVRCCCREGDKSLGRREEKTERADSPRRGCDPLSD